MILNLQSFVYLGLIIIRIKKLFSKIIGFKVKKIEKLIDISNENKSQEKY